MEAFVIIASKKWIAGIIALLLGCGLLGASGIASVAAAGTSDEAVKPIRIYLDGVWIRSDDAPPYIMPGANLTMVPVRVISKSLGATVDWEPSTKTVTVKKADMRIVMKVGQRTAQAGGKQVALEAPPELKNNRTMVPLRFISEHLGLLVGWEADTRQIFLTTPGPKVEMRGTWVSTVYNLDWPSDQSYGSPDRQKQEFVDMLNELQAMGIDTVFLQVRPAADAFYPSKLVPWSKYLTGTQGKDPGYDPLTYAIVEAHRRGMELHAWFNPFRASTDTKMDALAAGHVALQHPDWIVKSGGKMYVNPGIPAARQHVIDAVMEVVARYDIDGVHLDDYFYPSDGVFDDDAAFRAHNGKKLAGKGEWRRDNINDFVRLLGQEIHAVKPQLAYGISPFGVWRNQMDDPTGSATQASVSAYDSMGADARAWIRGGWIDYVMPQIYWSRGFKAADYDTLVKWWANEVNGTDVRLYIGHAPYKLGTKEAGWQSADEIISQLRFNRTIPQVKGDVFFSAKDLRRNPLNLVPALRSFYQVGQP